MQPKRKPRSSNLPGNNINADLSKAFDHVKVTTLHNSWNQQLALQQQHNKQQLVASGLLQPQQLSKQDFQHPLFSRTADYQLSKP